MLAGCSFYVDPVLGAVSATVFLARHARHDEVGVVLSGRSEIALNAEARRRRSGWPTALPRPARRGLRQPAAARRQTAAAVAARHGLAVTVPTGSTRSTSAAGRAGRSPRSPAIPPGRGGMPRAAPRQRRPARRWRQSRRARSRRRRRRWRAAGAVRQPLRRHPRRRRAVLGLPFERIFAFDIDCVGLTTVTSMVTRVARRAERGVAVTAALRRQVEALAPWFHNLDLGDGVQTAPDHFLGDYPRFKFARFAGALPDVTGKTVLDIGCNAGFYAIEMKRRGAARVVGIDSDDRYLAQARLAADALGARRDRVPQPVGLRRRARSANASISSSSWGCSTTCATRCWRST